MSRETLAVTRYDVIPTMTENTFRKLALSLPETTESAHMEHPDFRVNGKIFATLHAPSEGWAMVKLTPEQQESWVRAESEIFVPVKGGWGLRGATNVRLKSATERVVRDALLMAWRNTAPKKLVQQHELRGHDEI